MRGPVDWQLVWRDEEGVAAAVSLSQLTKVEAAGGAGQQGWHQRPKLLGAQTNSNLIGTDNPIHSPRIQVKAMVLRRDSIHKVHISEEMLWACVCNKSCLRGYSGTWLRRASCTEKFGVSGFTLGLLFYKSFVHQNTILNAIPQWFGLKRGLGFVLLKKKVCLL